MQGARESESDKGLHIVLISVHGLVRGDRIELGRDADTGGQIKYVVELARALGQNRKVRRVDLFTRSIKDPDVDAGYAQEIEKLAENVRIVRIPVGTSRYIRKERLWIYLDRFIDHALLYFRRTLSMPDIIHGHYADAGYVGSRIAALLGVPLVFTGHSLGRVKRLRLIEGGLKEETIESRYNISQRIEAEEIALDHADLVVTSTEQEIYKQYEHYENYHPDRMAVIPPGVDIERFRPPKRGFRRSPVLQELSRFLADPRKPIILAISRADERKNIATLVQAYGESSALQECANLVIIAGNRDDIDSLDSGAKKVLTRLLLDIDRYDLHGKVAYPKHHGDEDIPEFYRLAASTRGVFVNPALTEPFGLTLIEAAASGLPIVATEDGGPRDIVKNCKNGLLVDPLDAGKMAAVLRSVITDRGRWKELSRKGLQGVRRHYTWKNHVALYLSKAGALLPKRLSKKSIMLGKNRLLQVERLLVCDIDDTLLGDTKALSTLMRRVKYTNGKCGFGVATSRTFVEALDIIFLHKMIVPDIIITSAGAEIHYGHWMVEDTQWADQSRHRWDAAAIRSCLEQLHGLRLQPPKQQNERKVSYFVDENAPTLREIKRHLRHSGLRATTIMSRGQYLDVTPIRASKALALKYISLKWDIPFDQMLVAGGAGNDEEMLSGNALGVVVGNYSPEIKKLQNRDNVYFAEHRYAKGVLEGMDHYRFIQDSQ